MSILLSDYQLLDAIYFGKLQPSAIPGNRFGTLSKDVNMTSCDRRSSAELYDANTPALPMEFPQKDYRLPSGEIDSNSGKIRPPRMRKFRNAQMRPKR
jgi:hypothetical protein